MAVRSRVTRHVACGVDEGDHGRIVDTIEFASKLTNCLSVDECASELTNCLSVDECASALTNCLSVDDGDGDGYRSVWANSKTIFKLFFLI